LGKIKTGSETTFSFPNVGCSEAAIPSFCVFRINSAEAPNSFPVLPLFSDGFSLLSAVSRGQGRKINEGCFLGPLNIF